MRGWYFNSSSGREAVSPAIDQSGIKGFQKRPDLFRLICWVAAAATVAVLAWIIFEIAAAGDALNSEVWSRFPDEPKWVPNRNVYGVAPFLIGTTVSSLIALLFALPWVSRSQFFERRFLFHCQCGRSCVSRWKCSPLFRAWYTGCGAFSSLFPLFMRSRMGGGRFQNLPVLNTLFAPPAYGNSMLTASLVLALMILPTITAISRSALVAVPGTLREGALRSRINTLGGYFWRYSSHRRHQESSRRPFWRSDAQWAKPWPLRCSSGTVPA